MEPTPTVTETTTSPQIVIDNTTKFPEVTFPELTREPEVPKQNYIEFNSYVILPNKKIKLDKVIRLYNEGRFIGGLGQNYFPFVSTVSIGRGRERVIYYELIDLNNKVIFITDEEGLSLLFTSNNALAQA